MYTVLAGFQCVLKIIKNRTSESHFNTLGRVEAEDRAIIKRWGPAISPGYYGHGPRLRSKENRRKIEPKKPLTVRFPAHLLYLPSNLKFRDNPERKKKMVVELRKCTL